MPEKLQAQMILEIMGRPAEHVKEALNALIVKLGSEQGVNILDKKCHEPASVKDHSDIYTTFADITLELDEIGHYFFIIFAYMPSHIEIVQPEKFLLANFDLNDIGNGLIQRLHNYDAVTKNALAERNFLLEKIKEVSPELHKQLTTPPEKAEVKQKKSRKKS